MAVEIDNGAGDGSIKHWIPFTKVAQDAGGLPVSLGVGKEFSAWIKETQGCAAFVFSQKQPVLLVQGSFHEKRFWSTPTQGFATNPSMEA